MIDPQLEAIARSTFTHACAWCGYPPLQGHAPNCDVVTGKVIYSPPKPKPAPELHRSKTPIVDYAILAKKAKAKSFEKGDYWWKAHQFLLSLRGRAREDLSDKMRAWYMALRVELAGEVEDATKNQEGVHLPDARPPV